MLRVALLLSLADSSINSKLVASLPNDQIIWSRIFGATLQDPRGLTLDLLAELHVRYLI